jgi:hemoglobin
MMTRKTRAGLGVLLLTATLTLGACSAVPDEDNLYLALGGEQAIAVIVENFILEIARDERIIDHFEVSNVQRFRVMMNEHLCMVADGPCEYTGDSMIDTHAGMGVTEGDFNAIVENMMAAMNKAGIPLGPQNRLLARLATFRGEIIYR